MAGRTGQSALPQLGVGSRWNRIGPSGLFGASTLTAQSGATPLAFRALGTLGMLGGRI